MFNRTHLAAALAGVLTLSLGACSTKSSSAGDEADGIKLGTGVTSDSITLSMLTDLSGPFAPLGKDTLTGVQLFLDDLNKSGGICDRFDVELDVQDGGYVLQKSVQQYAAASSKSLALIGTMGSPANTTLAPRFEKDRIVNIPTGWGRSLTAWEGNIVPGATYDVDMANGVDYLIEQGTIEKGDTVGHIYFQGEYGENGLAGAEVAADAHGLKVLKAQIDPTDTDMTAQVTRLKSAGVKAIFLSAGPGQTASVAASVATEGIDGPILSSAPGFTPGLMDGPAAGVLSKQFYLTSPFLPTFPEGSKFATAYAKKNPGKTATNSMAAGAAQMQVLATVLEKACASKDMTREGVLKAKTSITDIATDGLMVPLNLSIVDASPSSKTNIERPADVPGTLEVAAQEFEGSSAKGL